MITQPRAYLSAEQLAELTPWTTDAIEKMVRRGFFIRGTHYFQPSGRRGRLLFKWDAIVALIEGRAARLGQQPVVEKKPVKVATQKRRLDVEKATTDLQRLLG